MIQKGSDENARKNEGNGSKLACTDRNPPAETQVDRQASADVAIVELVSTAGNIALSLIVAKPELKEMYLKTLNSAVEQVKKQLRHELKTRGI